MSHNMELSERVAQIRELAPKDAAEALVRLPADDIQYILSQLPSEQALTIASHLCDVAAPNAAATRAVLAGSEKTVGELMTAVTATLPDSATVAEALTFMVKSANVSDISYIFVT